MWEEFCNDKGVGEGVLVARRDARRRKAAWENEKRQCLKVRAKTPELKLVEVTY